METSTPPTHNIVNNIKNLNKNTIVGFLMGLIVFVVIYLIWWFYSLSTKETTTCKRFDSLYGKMNGKISSAYTSTNSGDFDHMFRDYYIKTAYNCCSTGDYKNGVVSTCALKSVIKQGVRGLDFEIYSIVVHIIIYKFWLYCNI